MSNCNARNCSVECLVKEFVKQYNSNAKYSNKDAYGMSYTRK